MKDQHFSAGRLIKISGLWFQSVSNLVGGFNHFLLSIIYGITLPIDELIFFKMVIAPTTSN